MADYLQQVVYNSSSEDRNLSHKQKKTLLESIEIREKKFIHN